PPLRGAPGGGCPPWGGEPRLGEQHPLVCHGRERTEGVIGGQVDGPDRPQQAGDDDVLLPLGTYAQLGPRTASLEEHRRGVAVPRGPWTRRCQVLEGVHLDRPLAA